MDWIAILNQALDYIEDNLLNGVTGEEAAAHVAVSSFHFQRTFRLLTGVTVGEYIRNRLLSMAGEEIAGRKIKIIDAAYKYGYETPESFSKAFYRLHGITPSQARRDGAGLVSYNRLVVKVILEGGEKIRYRIEEKDAFCLAVLKKTFSKENSDFDIPVFWEIYNADTRCDKLPGEIGICFEEEMGKDNEFAYGIGCKITGNEKIPEDYERFQVRAHKWAVFPCVGAMPDAIQNMWGKIYSEWLPGSSYELISGYDIEYYPEGDMDSEDYESEIWIPIREKERIS